MTYPQEDRRPMEEVWRKRVLEAEKSYRFAQGALNVAIGKLATSGETSDFARAQRMHEDAVVEYMRVLDVFHKLILNGERPSK
jgi:hypothetical protein